MALALKLRGSPIEFLFKIFNHMQLEKFLLLKQIEMWKFFNQGPMRPAVLVQAIQRVIPGKTQDFADSKVHQILLFLLAEESVSLAEFLDAN